MTIAIQNKITGRLVGLVMDEAAEKEIAQARIADRFDKGLSLDGPEIYEGFGPDTYESFEAAQAALHLFAEVAGKDEVDRLYRIVDLESEIIEPPSADWDFGR